MTFNPETAAIRFGTGLSPVHAPPASVDEMLSQLAGPDKMAERFTISTFAQIEGVMETVRVLNKTRRNDPSKGAEIKQQISRLRKRARLQQIKGLQANMARGMYTEDGFRERLVRFWADHFTVKGKNSLWRTAVAPFVEEAIRPNITGSFAEILKAATFHPMMLMFLDQVNSVGPNSVVAVRNPKRGINENLAREVLELHTLGVDGAYSQTDVYELAKLFSGLTYRRKGGFTYVPRMAEPGPETVLGKSYGGYIQDLFHVTDFLDDLAVHPDTARHLARKLVVHFVSDDPDEAYVAHVASAYRVSGGDLMATYRAMLTHDAAWAMPSTKVKQPIDFVISSLRALDLKDQRFTDLNWKKIRTLVVAPMGLMGQMWENPTGPDGWAEAAEHWITPQGLAARIGWAMTVPLLLRPKLPEPVRLAQTALGGRLSPALLRACGESDDKTDGVGLVFASPEFQRN